MSLSCSTLQQHLSLLAEKGFLDDNFKTSWAAGMWTREMEETFALAQKEAIENNHISHFRIRTAGKFNYFLDEVIFSLKYEYNPDTDSLSLKLVQAHMMKEHKTYLLPNSEDLPAASEIYRALSETNKVAHLQKLFQKMEQSDTKLKKNM